MNVTVPHRPLVEGTKKCTRCNEWKLLSKFSNSSDSPDGLQYWCKQCMHDYQEKHDHAPTKKAMAPEQTLAEQLADLDSRIPEDIKRHVADLTGSNGPVAKANAQEVDRRRSAHLAAWNARFYAGLAKERKELAKQRLLDRLEKALSIKKARDERQATLAKAKAEKDAADDRMTKALANQAAMLQQATALQEHTAEIRAQIDATIADADCRITRMLAVLDQHNAAVAEREARKAAWEASHIEREREEWAFKAGMTTDPILRAAYMERAEGNEFNSDDN